MRARLTTMDDGQIELESSYDRYFVERLKDTVPYGSRSWNGEKKRWLVSALYVAELLALLADAGYQVTDDRQAAQAPALAAENMPPELAQAFATLYLVPSAPLELAQAAFKFWSRYFHPDIGGDIQAFQRINQAMGTIKKYLSS